ncbi:phosphatidylinositol-specific phospholipase C [Rhodococcus maanshanensis]|uniref:1-phosphatidylinositol phosphodiesterase n=1 Tax=Rhodococcus maanshanensis TaxID=183556 RepID=A0A1H7XGX3_9NOCA|nr:phosphatidylinositol-specific phospholipase C [Rhodococcus maanshanensis]SEM33010.1 1-phosphatidylinositol phosphodiesterase [Rhodococcus maanshanensis]
MNFSVHRRGFARALVGLALATVVLPAPLASATTGSDAGSTSGSLESSGLADAVHPDWMAGLPDGAGLAELSLPGTHDTMASGASVFALTQDADLTTQLRAGVRAVDIRTRHFRDTFPIHHGIEYLNADFTDVVVALTDFLRANPSEAIVMRLKEEYTPAENTRSYEETLNWYIDQNPETSSRLREHLWRPPAGYDGGLPRLGEARGKLVVLRNFDAVAWPGPRFGDASMAIQDTYELTGLADIGRKWDLIRAQFERSRTGSSDILFVNHLSATGNPAAMVTGTVPVTVARGAPGVVGILPRTQEYLEAGGRGRLGAVMADFPTAELVTEIIAHNFP